MSKFFKAASYAVAFATLGVAALDAGPGFAAGDSDSAVELTSSTIKIDEAVLQSDREQAEIANSVNVKPVISENGDIVFEPGTGSFEQPLPEADPIVEEDKPLPVVVRNASSLRELVSLQDTSVALDRETECLAGAVYFESKSEPLVGQLAVARVVMARAASKRFPNSLCGVVYQKRQFSFVRGGRMPRINKKHQQWRNAVAISKIALADAWDSKMEGALFFHAKYVNPKWRLKRMGSVGQHIFYR